MSDTKTDPRTLKEEELQVLERWQTKMIWSFALAMGILLIAVPLKLMGALPGSVETILGLLFIALAIFGGFTQFSAKCPNCGSRIGFQSRLLLPSRCVKCGVSFRRNEK